MEKNQRAEGVMELFRQMPAEEQKKIIEESLLFAEFDKFCCELVHESGDLLGRHVVD